MDLVILPELPTPRFQQHGLALKIPISWVDLPSGDVKFPVLRITDTISYLVHWGYINKLLGDMPMSEAKPTLLTFWRRFSKQNPGHQVFDSNVSLSRAIPVMIHGDEGRGFKRSGVMMLSVQGAIGRGSRPFRKRHSLKALRDNRMGVNIGGSSYNSRLLFGAMPKKHYSVHPELCLCEAFYLFWGLGFAS